MHFLTYSKTSKKTLLILICLLLFYVRFIGLDWGLPFPFHPDERNMANAVQDLQCEKLNIECLNPHFFAYGQLPLYLARLSPFSTSFIGATMALRLISALSSLGTLYVLSKLTKKRLLLLLFIGFSPGLIQWAHFGTTESLLILMASLLLYLGWKVIEKKEFSRQSALLFGLLLGIAIGIKLSAAVLVVIPLVCYFMTVQKKTWMNGFLVPFFIFLGFVIASPQSLIHFSEFYSSMQYEIGVGSGLFRVFYTRQFEYSIPVLFQLFKIYPFILGPVQLLFFLLSWFVIPVKNKQLLLLRFVWVATFLSGAATYAKWSRFTALSVPFALLLAFLCCIELMRRIGKKYLFAVVFFFAMLPGLMYATIYRTQDVRLQASEWMQRHIPENSSVMQESGNVIDLPLSNQTLRMNIVDLYDLKEIPQDAEYVIVPSRRVFANMWCPDSNSQLSKVQRIDSLVYSSNRCKGLSAQYPLVSEWYPRLVNNYTLVATFSSRPKIRLFGKTVWEFDDEWAEETWTVFDHPTIRIYKRI